MRWVHFYRKKIVIYDQVLVDSKYPPTHPTSHIFKEMIIISSWLWIWRGKTFPNLILDKNLFCFWNSWIYKFLNSNLPTPAPSPPTGKYLVTSQNKIEYLYFPFKKTSKLLEEKQLYRLLLLSRVTHKGWDDSKEYFFENS